MKNLEVLLGPELKRFVERQERPGPVVWCKRCSRKHPRRKVCDLYLRPRIAKSGRTVHRWCH